jgi:acyl carrier protein
MKRELPPLRGVWHCAVLLDDGLLRQVSDERFRAVLAPKTQGAWNLHRLTAEYDLDHFVLFSSGAALLGSPGQGNYAAGNAFLDGLAHHRRGLNLPAISINWGPWAEVGQAAAQANRGERLSYRGVGSIPPQQGIAALTWLLGQPATQAAVMAFDPRQWCQFYPHAAAISLLAQLAAPQQVEAPSAPDETFRQTLLAESPRRQLALLEDHIREQVARVLRLAPDRVDPQMPLTALGFDSLMALELRNRLEISLGLKLSVTIVWSYPTVAAQAAFLAGELGLSEPPADPAPAEDDDLAALLSRIEGLSDDEIDGMLED